MYRFISWVYGTLYTVFSPKEVSMFTCFDAMAESGELLVISMDDVDFMSFEYVG